MKIMFKITVQMLRRTCLSIQFLCTPLFCLYIFLGTSSYANTSVSPLPKRVFVYSINEEITPIVLRTFSRAMLQAENLHADYFILELNTYGGLLDVADSLRTKILNSSIPVYAFINHNAASAGALIAISCDSIYMVANGTIGSATVVDQDGKPLPDKYQSYMRALMRVTASAHGRDPKIAEGMVTPNNYLKDVADTGKIIAMTAAEAKQHNYCNAIVANLNDLLAAAKISSPKISYFQSSWIDAFISFLMNPIVNSLLLFLMLAGIYFEFQHPGLGLPLLTGLIGAFFYFMPLYIDGLAANWEIAVFIAGLALLLLEIFVFPGHGIWAITGIILMIAGLTLSLLRNFDFNFDYSGFDTLLLALLRVSVIMLLLILYFIFFGARVFQSKRFSKIVLQDTQLDTKAFVMNVHSHQDLIHQTGIARTPLRPAGSILINGEPYDAVSDGTYILKDEEVVVTGVKGSYLIVRKNNG